MNHLTFSERLTIETGNEKKLSFREIARLIRRHPTTVSKEILSNRIHISSNYPWQNDCQFAKSCKLKNVCGDEKCTYKCPQCKRGYCHRFCERYKPRGCKAVLKVPYVCNTCSDKRYCIHEKYLYTARSADAKSLRRLSDSRSGIRIDNESLEKLDKLISRLVKKGQPLVHIYEEHKEEIPVGLRSLYNYIDDGILTIRNIDLRRKTGYRPRKNGKAAPVLSFENMEFRRGRDYEDYQREVKNPELLVTELDTVKGVREKGKRLLTMIMRKNSVMLLFLLPDGTADSVINVFNFLDEGLGTERFKRLFPVFLTDNGSEFKKVEELELSMELKERTKVYYCDPMASWQKPHIEKNHEYIRYVIPKGKSLNHLEEEDITLLMNHINSVKRKGLGKKSPYEMIDENDADMLALMQLMKMHLIPPDEVHLKPDLFKK